MNILWKTLPTLDIYDTSISDIRNSNDIPDNIKNSLMKLIDTELEFRNEKTNQRY